MKPFYKLRPAFWFGADTPWGGDALRWVFGKDVPGEHTGEALEASTLPGMESTTEDGRTLTEIAGGPLPLLLKLLDAREPLSVQIHPDNAYAAEHEDGKLGKAEAWVILEAEYGAKLVYGLLPGTDLSKLSGKDIEEHLRWIDVHPGDVLDIPPGMVHAIGGGILLYEIQQASNVTYRFWDWERRDDEGNLRALHWDKACDVARVDLQMEPVLGTTATYHGGTVTRYIENDYFMLDRYHVLYALPLAYHDGFQLVTALGDVRLVCGEEAVSLSSGDTAYVPPGAKDIVIEGRCDLLVSAEALR